MHVFVRITLSLANWRLTQKREVIFTSVGYHNLNLAKGDEAVKTMVLVITLTLLACTSVSAQTREQTLSGLKGVRLTVMYGRSNDGLDEAQRPQVLKMLQEQAKAKFVEAGIPLLATSDQSLPSCMPHFVVYVTLMKDASFAPPIMVEAKFFQKARLWRDPTKEIDAETWSSYGIGGPIVKTDVLENVFTQQVDAFIKAYQLANPQTRASNNHVTLEL